MNIRKELFTKKDCILYDAERDVCKGLKELYCAKCKKCNFYKTKDESKKKW